MQKFKFNVTGKERKKLVTAIGEITQSPAKYLGMPTAAYEVGSYHIDKSGTVTGEWDLNLFVGLADRGFEPELEELGFVGTVEDCGDDTPKQSKGIMDCLVEALNENGVECERMNRTPTIIDPSGREHNLNGTFATKTEYGKVSKRDLPALYTLETPRGEIFITEEFTARDEAVAEGYGEYFTTALGTIYSYGDDHTFALVFTHKAGYWDNTTIKRDFRENAADEDCDNELPDTITVEIPKNGLTNTQVQNILKLAESKRSLLTKALGAPLEIYDTGENVQFVLPYSEEAGLAEIHSQFATAMVKYVRKHQRVAATERKVESEKFALRAFLVKIGMNGPEYSACRKWYCRNLSGNASFASNAKYTAMQESRRNTGETEVGGDVE